MFFFPPCCFDMAVYPAVSRTVVCGSHANLASSSSISRSPSLSLSNVFLLNGQQVHVSAHINTHFTLSHTHTQLHRRVPFRIIAVWCERICPFLTLFKHFFFKPAQLVQTLEVLFKCVFAWFIVDTHSLHKQPTDMAHFIAFGFVCVIRAFLLNQYWPFINKHQR